MHAARPPSPRDRRQSVRLRNPRPVVHGFSLIEVLVVILIMTFGLLGIAGLQAATAKFKVNAWVRSAASVQFSDLADRLRANPAQAGGRYVAATGAPSVASVYVVDDDWDTQQPADLTPAVDCLVTVCTAAQRATFDLLAWRAEVRRQFPQGAVALSGDVAVGVTATIAWFDRQFTNAAGALQSSEQCTAGMNAARAANCCPASLDAPEGVRCTNMLIHP